MLRTLCIRFIFILAMSTLLSQAHATKVGDVDVPDTLTVGENHLRLNGVGVRESYFMDMYVGALYLKDRTSNARNIINADKPMAIRLHILSSMITSDRMEEATRDGFDKSTNGNTAPIRKEIEAFINVFRAKIKPGDIYDLVYTPGKGTEVLKNGKSASVTKGLPLKKALFGIWLGEEPPQKDLKEAMLGK